MLIFRIACAIMMAWAMNFALARPEAAFLVEEVPEMHYFGPIAGALVGFLILAKRQGNGILIGTLNGMWTGLLTIAISGALFLTVQMWSALVHGLIRDFENFMRVLGIEARPLMEVSADLWLIGVTVATTAVVGLTSEILRLCLRWARKARGEEEEKPEVRAGVAKAGGALS